MKKNLSYSATFEIARLIDKLAKQNGVSFSKIKDTTMLEYLAIESKKIEQEKNRSYGYRTQFMFAYVAAALGGCTIITEEDTGLSFPTGIKRPDYRIVTNKGTEFLVEVKNFHPKNPNAPFSVTREYLARLQSYSKLMNKDLKFAIFLSRWNIWTLVSDKCFEAIGDKCTISLSEVMESNEMGILGEVTIGTVPPLALKIFTDPDKPRRIHPDAAFPFTVKRAVLYAGGKEIQDTLEQRLALIFMLYSRWNIIETPPEIVDGELISFEFQCAPENITPNQGFEMIGALSQIVTNRYKELTSPDGKISLFSPKEDPSDLAVLIPSDYKGKILQLWRFKLIPKHACKL
jgi:hypothetical protein